MAEISISIEIKYFGGDNNIIATINVIPYHGSIYAFLCMWPWLLHLFAKML
jgi:hypothetical protein